MTAVVEREALVEQTPAPARRRSVLWTVALVLVASVPSIALVASTGFDSIGEGATANKWPDAARTEPTLITQVSNVISCAVDTAGLRAVLSTAEGVTPEQIDSTISLLTFGRCPA